MTLCGQSIGFAALRSHTLPDYLLFSDRPGMVKVTHGEYILGNASLHLQLATALSVMTQLICNPSSPPSAHAMSESLGVSLRYLRKLLRTLAAGGLLRPHERNNDTWICTRAPHMISLADIYACLVTDQEEAKTSPFIPVAQGEAGASGADLLMMQATMAINQVVQQHLQRFDLGRLKIAESAMLFASSLREKTFTSAGISGDVQALFSLENDLQSDDCVRDSI